jgi:hypothetical protein
VYVYMGIAETQMKKSIKIKTAFESYSYFFYVHKCSKFRKILLLGHFSNFGLMF